VHFVVPSARRVTGPPGARGGSRVVDLCDELLVLADELPVLANELPPNPVRRAAPVRAHVL
jgi:hypothetical protein